MTGESRRRLAAAIGPGVLFAGTAIGVSHLVQSTRAGAVHGLGFVLIIVLVHALKYPAFRFAPHFVAATGESLLHGYRRRGRAILVLYFLTFLPTLCTVMAALGITLAGLAGVTFQVTMTPPVLASLLVVAAVVLTLAGGFALLDRLTKVFVAFLTLATLAATVLVLPRIDWQWASLAPPALDGATLAFLIALAGFMPAGLDLSVMHSLWSVARARQTGLRAPIAEAMVDFNIGYVASIVLALCFVLMGAGVMHQEGVVPEAGAAAFAAQVVSLYEQTLGAWSGALVGASAFAVLLTTLLAITDGFPRVVAAVLAQVSSPTPGSARGGRRDPAYVGVMLAMAAVAVLMLHFALSSFRAFIDLVTTVGFITSPIIALLNHLAVTGPDVPQALRPGIWLRRWSLLGVLVLFAVAIAYGVMSWLTASSS
ncbi:MAG: divalent metal cation transporter [Pseudomonadota bacterium]